MKTNIYKTTRKFEYKGAGTNDYIEKVYDTDDDCESRIEHKKYKKEDGTEVEISKTFGSDWDEDNSFELCNTTTVEKDTEGNKLTKFDSDMMYSERIEDKNDIIIMKSLSLEILKMFLKNIKFKKQQKKLIIIKINMEQLR